MKSILPLVIITLVTPWLWVYFSFVVKPFANGHHILLSTLMTLILIWLTIKSYSKLN